MNLTFQHPLLLLLLLALPLLAGAAWRAGFLRRRHGVASTALRLLTALALILAAAGLAVAVERDELAVLFVVDHSRSIAPDDTAAPGGGVARAHDFVQRALDAMPEGDRAGVIVFGAEPQIESLVRPDPSPPLWSARPDPGATALEDALRLALASFPPDTHRRVVVLSDGIETHGHAANQAIVAREVQIPVDVVTLPTATSGPDVIAEALTAPPTAEAFQPFELRLQVRAPQDAPGRVLLYRNDQLLGELPVQLTSGLGVITIPQTLDQPGLYRFRAVVEAQPDGEPRNNEARATVEVSGTPRVLHLEGYADAAPHLRDALINGGYAVTTGGPGDLPDTLQGLVPYDLIILSDIPATEMTRPQMSALEHYVNDLGKGLIMVGGDLSFGLGGYFKTPIERVLPVQMTRKAQLDLPAQGMVLVVDRSGSMAGFQGVSKMDLAKDAAVAVVELLTPKDELGLVAFDDAASWVIPYEPLSDKRDAIYRIGTIHPGGGTDIYNGLRSAYGGMGGGEAAVKHIILLSDGIAENSNLPALAQKLREDKITLSTVAVGADSDRYTLETLARIGGGRYYETESPDTIPQIFTRETMLSSRQFLIETTFVPAAADPSEILNGIDALPPLRGYVATTAKPTATVALLTPEKEPLLAHWRSGLGKTLAFTSDAKPRWAQAWIDDPQTFGRFWSQAVRWTANTGARNNLAVQANLRGSTLSITADSMSDDTWIDGAETRAFVISPDGKRLEVPLRQVAPGRYRAEIDAPTEGAWFVSVQQTLNGEETGRAVREVFRAWSPELAPAHVGTPVLQELATATGGRIDPDPAALWERPPQPLTVPHPLAPWLLAFAALAWLLDVAIRRFEGLRLPTRHPTPKPVTVQHLPPRAVSRQRATTQPSYKVGLGAAPADDSTPPESPPEDTSAPPEPPTFTNRLLDAKRRAKK